MADPIPAEIAEMIKGTSSPGGAVKTLTDLKLEGFEKRLTELEKINAELRQANAELYAFAMSKGQTAASAEEPKAETSTTEFASAQVVPQEQPGVSEQQAREDALFSGVMAEMNKNKIPNQTKPLDGM